MTPRFGSLVVYTSGCQIGGMDPNGYGAISTYNVGMIWKNGKVMAKSSKVKESVTKSVFGETFTMYL